MGELEGHPDFNEYDYVMKTKGYLYPGVVVSRFNTSEGKTRYVVESVALATKGMLHIYSAENLRYMTMEEVTAYVHPWMEETRVGYKKWLEGKKTKNAGP